MGRQSKLAGVAAAFLLAATWTTPAAAGIPIPCTSDKSFKMAEQGVKRQDGKTIYLGYKYSGCFSGEWIGYLDGRSYLKLPSQEAALVLAMAGGMQELPEPPGQLSNPKAFWVEWLWAALLGLGAIGTALNAVARADERARGEPVRA